MSQPSPARVAANRRNALKSTGPCTNSGKTRVAQNALKHGLRSDRNPLDLADDSATSIDRDAFLTTLAGYNAQFAPATPLETRLVERLAQIDIRLARAQRIETAIFDQSAIRVLAKENDAYTTIAHDSGRRIADNCLLMRSFLTGEHSLTLLGRYESRLSRDFARTLKQLRDAQNSRLQTQPENLPEQTQSPAQGASNIRPISASAKEISAEQTQLDRSPAVSRASHTQGETQVSACNEYAPDR